MQDEVIKVYHRLPLLLNRDVMAAALTATSVFFHRLQYIGNTVMAANAHNVPIRNILIARERKRLCVYVILSVG